MTLPELTAAIISTTESDEPAFVANIPSFIQQAEQTIYTSVQLPATQGVATPSTVAANRFLAVPTGFLAPGSLGILNGGVTRWLFFKDVEWMQEAYPDAVTVGQPKYYAIYDDTQFILGPTPDAVYPTEVHYFRLPVSIVTAGTSWLGDHWDSVLLYGSLVYAASFLKLEKETVDLYDSLFKQNLSLLKKVGDGMDRQDSYFTAQVKNVVK
jgi:hypothetical protein